MDDRIFAEIVRRQYRAGLEMLRNAAEACPDDLWDRRDPTEAPFWQHAMHVLYYTHLYLMPAIEDAGTREGAEEAMRQLGSPMKNWSDDEVGRLGRSLGGLCSPDARPQRVMTRDEILAWVAKAEQAAEEMAGQVGEAGAEGKNPMPWMTGSRGDLLLYNLRHLQHHVGRLHSILGRTGIRVDWVGGIS